MKRRVVITGRGAVSCLGNSPGEIGRRLERGDSGLRRIDEWSALSLACHVGGVPDDWTDELKSRGVENRHLRGMSEAGQMALVAALQALEECGLAPRELSTLASVCVVGCGVSDVTAVHDTVSAAASGRAKRISPYSIVRSMSNAASASITTAVPVSGLNVSLGAACASSTHAIGLARHLIVSGVADIAVCGGAEAVHPAIVGGFQAMRGALSTTFNDRPEQASRPFDRDRDGFVPSGGAAIVILEALDHASGRDAEPLAEVLGWGASSDGHDVVQPDPSGAGAARCMRAALADAGLTRVDYVNAHGTSTVQGDAAELRALREIFGSSVPPLSSTKSMNGHSIAAAGALEVIHCTEMLRGGFLAPNLNLASLDAEFVGFPVLRQAERLAATTMISNSFGFGGTNACVVLGK